MIEEIAEHSIDTDMLWPEASVLDIGCRGFNFGTEILKLVPDARLTEIDIAILSEPPRAYRRIGIEDHTGTGACSHSPDPQAVHVIHGNEFPLITLDAFSKENGIDMWDIVKMDCEGSEYGILTSLHRPVAKQITVEFHEHLQHRKRGDAAIAAIVAHIGQWYTVRRHISDSRHDAGFNYWDSLFTLK